MMEKLILPLFKNNKILVLVYFLFMLGDQNVYAQTNPSISLMPGEVKVFTIPKHLSVDEIYCGKTSVLKFTKSAVDYFLFAPSYFSKVGQTIKCVGIDKKNKAQESLSEFIITDGKFKKEILKVDQKKVHLKKEDLIRVRREASELSEIYRNFNPAPFFVNSFILPIESFITSIYGTKRIFNNHKKTQHLGTDFRASVGEPIKCVNRGRVVLAKDLFYSGNTIIIDHGLSLFSVFAHLSAIDVKISDMVESGQIIGKSGDTGRVSGPHLHWGVKLHNDWIDGISLINAFKQI